MPSGESKDEVRRCRMCKRKLRKLYKFDDWGDRQFHITCFNQLIKDLPNFKNITYTKLRAKKNKNTIQTNIVIAEPGANFTLNFD